MEESKKLITFNVRKDKRFEAKKRKMEALLNLFEESNKAIVPKKKKKTGETLEESYKSLKNELKRFTKKPEVDPCFYLTKLGSKAELKFLFSESNRPPVDVSLPIFTEDIYHLLLSSVIGHQSPYTMKWAKLEQPQNVCKTVLLVVEGFTKLNIIQNRSELNNIPLLFPHIVEIVSPNIPFAMELSTLHQITDYHIKAKEAYSTLFPKEKDVKVEVQKNVCTPSKLHLLLSPIQMVMDSYPLPISVFQFSKSENYVFSKKSYSPVTKESPLFAIDCEMCRTDAGLNELTRVAVVNEKLETIYESLVKPQTKIVDYMTRYSGITKAMLCDVTVKLSDVQQHIQDLLPTDAILCGHSLNFDLHALKVIHPYVIDTSIIFNASGMRGRKDSLRNLTRMHLNEVIQKGKKGHNPIEDAIATMKLVQLKLKNGVQYGDACLHNCELKTNEIANCCSSDVLKESLSAKPDVKSVLETQDEGFFSRLSKCSKRTCLIGNADSLNHYPANTVAENVQQFVKSNVTKVVKATTKHMSNFDFTISHVVFNFTDMSDSIKELNNILNQIYDSCIENTMFMVLVSGVDETKFEDIKSGLFLTALRKVKVTN